MKVKTYKAKPELLAPAGDFEKLQIAIAYGADAVYLSGTSFGLRAKAKNFNESELPAAISYAHERGVRCYITANIFAHNNDIDEMTGYFSALAGIKADAFIISDPGVFALARKEAPEVEIHISTQANTTNYASVKFWQDIKASRIILARELSLKEIAEIREKSDIALEGFVHGAMCMSYSGRCILSRYMTDRDANLGACAHPCRYNYRLYAEEVTRPGYFMPVEENERGTDIFGAEDLCMAAHIPELMDAGIEGFKIEGRMKTAFYVGPTVKAYRQAIDAAFENREKYESEVPYYIEMLKMASHRPFSTGFYFGKPKSETASYTRSHDFVGIVREYGAGRAVIEQRGVFEAGDILTFIRPRGTDFSRRVDEMYDEKGIKITRAPHAQQRVSFELAEPMEPLTLVCKRVNS